MDRVQDYDQFVLFLLDTPSNSIEHSCSDNVISILLTRSIRTFKSEYITILNTKIYPDLSYPLASKLHL